MRRRPFTTNPDKDRRRVEHAITRDEYLAYVEQKGHPVNWAPCHTRQPSPLNSMNHPHTNQVPPAKTQT